jgi:hypothetical protein
VAIITFFVIYFQAVPCHFKERLNLFADKWLPCVASGHRYELFLEKIGYGTYIMGPYWKSFRRSHNIALGDVVTFKLDKKLRKRKRKMSMRKMKMRKDLKKMMRNKKQKSMCSI